MTTARRFLGTAIAALLVVVAVVVLRVLGSPEGDAPPPEEIQEPIFAFEKEDLVGFRIVRPDLTLAMEEVGGEWTVVGHTWRPSSSMVRRVAHQLHDLTARATVLVAAASEEDYATYGLGDEAIRVELSLAGGRTLAFVAGDPNPSSVSYYIRPVPGDRVYVVKKSALDYYRLDLDSFREDKFAVFDAREVSALEAEVDGRALRFERTGEHTWRMSAPIAQDASRDKVRAMLGRVSALKAFAFVSDGPDGLAGWGLDPPRHRIRVVVDTGEVVTIEVGDPVPGSEPAQRYVRRVEDDAVYAVKDGMLESFQEPVEAYRNLIMIGKHEWDVASMVVHLDGEAIPVSKSADDWRWPDGQAIPGSTPARVAGRAADIQAVAFHDGVSRGAAGIERPSVRVELVFEDGTSAGISVGGSFEVTVEQPGEEGVEERPETHHYAAVDGADAVFEVDDQLVEVVRDLHREYGRKQEREAERRVDLRAEAEAEGAGEP